MINIINSLILFFIGILFHELGHYIEYKRQKRDVKIYISWFGGIMMEDKNIYSNTPNNYNKIGFAGILLGFPFFIFIPSGILIYLIVSMLDINIILMNLSKPKEDRNKTYKILLKKEYKEVFKK